MSPEPARGRPVDRRADSWAFGCVLFEMLTGRRAFDGQTVSDVLAAVVRDQPAFDALPPDVPPSIRRLLRRCLEKDRARRLDSMRDACLEIDEPGEPASNAGASPANEAWAEVSPDGRWIAYGSDSSGRSEVYVQSFPGLGRREQISTAGGDSPLWSRNGRELFFLSARDGLVYDVAPDGRRLLMTEWLDPPAQPVTRLRVVFKWVEEMRRAERLGR